MRLRKSVFKNMTAALVLLAIPGFLIYLYKYPITDTSQASENTTDSESAGKMNFSWFVFRDVNRNGIYDTSDHPYAGMPIRLNAPDGHSVVQKSNLNGFANFKMSTNPQIGPIHEVGRHVLTAQIPKDWKATSGVKEVAIPISQLAGSPAGLISERVLDPLGVAPIPRVEGHVPGPSNRLELIALSPSGKRQEVSLSDAGDFQIRGEPGKWQLMLTNRKTGKRVEREIQVGGYPKILAEAFFSQPRVPKGDEIVTVNYDDRIATENIQEIPKGYRGLDWKNWIITHNFFYQGYGYINATISSKFLAYSSSGHPATISRDKPFNFVGSYVGVAWPEAKRGKVHIEGYRDGELRYHEQMKLGPETPVYFHANYRSITRLVIYSDAYWQVLLDDSRFQLLD